MFYITKKEVKNSKFPELSNEVKKLKETEGVSKEILFRMGFTEEEYTEAESALLQTV